MDNWAVDRLTNMEAFVRVVDAGSFRAAARQWRRSTAVVSKYVAALEAHLGVELMRRSTRALRLTEAGHAYYAECRALLGAVEAMEADVRDEHVAPKGWLRVTAPPGFVHRHYDLVLTDFMARYPSIKLDLQLTHRMVDLVEQGFDVAIRVTAPVDSSLVARRLGPAPLVLVAAPAYLERAGLPVSAADLAGHACLVDSNFRDGARWRFETQDGLQTVQVDGPVRVDSPLIVERLARDGRGLGLTPAFVAAEGLASGALVEVDVGRPAFDWSMFAVYPRRRFVSGRVRAFVDHLAEGLAEGRAL